MDHFPSILTMGKDFFKGPPMKRKWSMDLFWNFIKYFNKLMNGIFLKHFKNMGDLWKYMFFAIIPFFHVWSFVTKTITLCLFISSNYAWLHLGINCFQGFTTLPKWIYIKNKKNSKNSKNIYIHLVNVVKPWKKLIPRCNHA